MFKKIVYLLIIFSVLFITVSCKSGEKKVKDFPEYVNNLDSYKVTGKLYSMFPTGTKESLITVYFQKPENYRVEIDKSTNGDKQIILKNQEGLYVLIPSVNKTYQLKSGWPVNSSYPYLLQSLAKDYINDDSRVITENDNNTTVDLNVKLFNDVKVVKQTIVFDNETGLPLEVQMYDESNNLQSRFIYMNIEENPTLDKNLFCKNETQTASFETYGSIEYSRETTYPTYYPSSTSLKDEKKVSGSNQDITIMTFTGDVNYTIIQEYIYKSDKERSEYLESEIIVMGDFVGFINNNVLTFFSEGVLYTLASNEVSTLELLKIGNSLIVTQEK